MAITQIHTRASTHATHTYECMDAHNARALLLIANLIVPNLNVAVMLPPCAICSPYNKSGEKSQAAQELQPLTECKLKVNLDP